MSFVRNIATASIGTVLNEEIIFLLLSHRRVRFFLKKSILYNAVKLYYTNQWFDICIKREIHNSVLTVSGWLSR